MAHLPCWVVAVSVQEVRVLQGLLVVGMVQEVEGTQDNHRQEQLTATQAPREWLLFMNTLDI